MLSFYLFYGEVDPLHIPWESGPTQFVLCASIIIFLFRNFFVNFFKDPVCTVIKDAVKAPACTVIKDAVKDPACTVIKDAVF